MKKMLINLYLLFAHIQWIISDTFEKDTSIINVLCDGTDLGQARSATECAGFCDISPSCISFFFVKPEKLCKGCDTIYGSTIGCASKTSSVYYKTKDVTATTPTTTSSTTTSTTTTTTTSTTTVAPPSVNYNDACTTDGDCTLSMTHCLQGTCQCIAGYSYDSGTGGCVENCNAYGNTYIYYQGMSLDVPILDEQNGVNLIDCKNLCASISGCRGFSFCPGCGPLCRIRDGTPLTHPDKYFATTSVHYYFRNCV